MNEPKHTLAVLRRTIGLEQKQMADLLGCSLATIQAVEYCKLPLSGGLASEVARQTGVALAWLLSGDASAPPVDDFGEPYSRARYEDRQAGLRSKLDRQGDALKVRFQVAEGIRIFAGAASAAIRSDKYALFNWKMVQALTALQKEFGNDFAEKEYEPMTGLSGSKAERVFEKDAADSLSALWRALDAKVKKPCLRASVLRPRPRSRRASR
jgi:transcriptional regulator with XRE-family HTH domain